MNEDGTSYVKVEIFSLANARFRLIMSAYASGEQAKQESFEGSQNQMEKVKQRKELEYIKFVEGKLSLESGILNDAQKEVLANLGLDELTVAHLMTEAYMSFNDQESSQQRVTTVGSSGFFHHDAAVPVRNTTDTTRDNLQPDDAMDTTGDAPSKDDDDVDMEGNKP